MNVKSNNLARLVRTKREAVGLTASQLADLAGIDRSIVARIESGTRVPSPETLAALAPVLETELADLYVAAGYPVPEPPTLRHYLRRAYGMSADQIEDIEAYLQQIGERNGGTSVPGNGEDEQPE